LGYTSVSEKDLTERLIDDFTEMTQGLLSNIALKSLGALRDNTHRILHKFDKRLDAPYLTHRALVSPADEAQQHPVPLLTAEFNDVLEDCGIDGNASIEIIEKWIDHQLHHGEMDLINKFESYSVAQLRKALSELIRNGIGVEVERLKTDTTLSKWRKKLETISRGDSDHFLTQLLIKDETADSRDLDFAILTTMRSRYDNPEPILTLGTLVAISQSGKENFFLCIQPVCDSVRLKKDTVFPFLRLHDSTEPNEYGKIKPSFNIVIHDNGNYKKLRTNLKPRDILLTVLKHQVSGEIRAKQAPNKSYFFKTLGTKPNLRWIGNLKFAHAQRIANDFAREISRVGLVESDWLRRMNNS
jgi:hypothetical protein